MIFTAEVVVLAVWGHMTPGAPITNLEALLVLGGTALLMSLISFSAYTLLPARAGRSGAQQSAPSVEPASTGVHAASAWTSAVFVGVLAAGALSIGGSINSIVVMGVAGISAPEVGTLAVSLAGLSLSVLVATLLLYRLDFGRGRIKRRVRAFEVGWRE